MNANSLFISFDSPINPMTASALKAEIVDAVNGREHEEAGIGLLLSSPGGDVNAGIALYNLITAVPTPIDTYNIGSVDSIANIVFQAGRKRFASMASRFMFHDVGFEIEKERLETRQLEEKLSNLKNDHEIMSGILENRSALSSEQIREFFRKQKFFHADALLEYGLVDEVSQFRLPHGVHVRHVVFS